MPLCDTNCLRAAAVFMRGDVTDTGELTAPIADLESRGGDGSTAGGCQRTMRPLVDEISRLRFRMSRKHPNRGAGTGCIRSVAKPVSDQHITESALAFDAPGIPRNDLARLGEEQQAGEFLQQPAPP